MVVHLRLALLPAALLAAATAFAGGQSAPGSGSSFGQHWLRTLDTDGDGRVSLDEFLAAETAHFKSIDTQNKGVIDANDIAASPRTLERDQRIAQSKIKRMDTQGSGMVDENEYLADAAARFAKLDANGDGVLTPDELRGEHGWHAGKAATDKSVGAATAPGSRHAAFAQHYFDRLDADHDGKVTLNEYLADASAHFKRLDANNDGKLDANEIATSQETVRRDQHMAKMMIRHMGAGEDGTVSLDQFLDSAPQHFAKMDKNGDGYLSADELTWHRGFASRPHPTQAR